MAFNNTPYDEIKYLPTDIKLDILTLHKAGLIGYRQNELTAHKICELLEVLIKVMSGDKKSEITSYKDFSADATLYPKQFEDSEKYREQRMNQNVFQRLLEMAE